MLRDLLQHGQILNFKFKTDNFFILMETRKSFNRRNTPTMSDGINGQLFSTACLRLSLSLYLDKNRIFRWPFIELALS